MKYYAFLALLGLGLAGCSSSPQQEAQVQPTEASAAVQTIEAPEPQTSPAPPATPVARSMVYRGELSLTVDDFEQASANIDQLLAAHHAYLDTAHESRSDTEHQQDMTIKVWPSEFTNLVAALGRLGRIDRKDITSADVTADLLDSGRSAQNTQASATQLRALLAKTTDAGQRRHLTEQLHQAQQDAETAQAHLQDTRSQSRWAVLKLHFTQQLPATEPPSPLPAFLPRWQTAFNNGWSVLLEVVVVLTNLWPLLLLGAVATGAIRYWRHRHPADVV